MSTPHTREHAAPPAWIGVAAALCATIGLLLVASQLLRSTPALSLAKLRSGLPQRELAPLDWPEFQLRDQDGRGLSRADLQGTVWIADFLSLQCTTCPPLSGRIADVQERLRQRGVRFVSFSIDPSSSAGALQQQRAKHRRVDPARWTLLQADAECVPRLLCWLGLAQSPELARALICSLRPHFFLVDRQGRLCGSYSADDPRQLEWLASDADALASAGDGTPATSDEPR